MSTSALAQLRRSGLCVFLAGGLAIVAGCNSKGTSAAASPSGAMQGGTGISRDDNGAPTAVSLLDNTSMERAGENLKQIALAAHDYRASYDKLPPGWLGANPDGTAGQLGLPPLPARKISYTAE